MKIRPLVASNSWDEKAKKKWGQIRHWLDKLGLTVISWGILNIACHFDWFCIDLDEQSWGQIVIGLDTMVNTLITAGITISGLAVQWWVHISSLIAAKEGR